MNQPQQQRTCINHKQAQFICTSLQCQQECVYICPLLNDQCRQDHIQCRLVSLKYLGQQINKQLKQQHHISNGSSKLFQKLQCLCQTGLALFKSVLSICKMTKLAMNALLFMNPNGVVSLQQKELICEFVDKLKAEKRSKNNENENRNSTTNVNAPKQLCLQKSQQFIVNNGPMSIRTLQDELNNVNMGISEFLEQLNASDKNGGTDEEDTLAKHFNQENQKAIQKVAKMMKQQISMIQVPPNQNQEIQEINNKSKDKSKGNVNSNGNSKVRNSLQKRTAMQAPIPVSSGNRLSSKDQIGSKSELFNDLSPKKSKSKILPSNGKLQKINPISGKKAMPTPFLQKILLLQSNHKQQQPLKIVGPLYSHITSDIETLQTFFCEKIVSADLLYRASQNKFSASKFHEKCDGITHTLTIVATQFNKIIGGYTPLPWSSTGGEWFQDPSKSSFIFNLSSVGSDSGERYPLQNKQKAIWCSSSFGPSFGFPDLQIADKAQHNSNSCVNFPQCYNNGNYNKGANGAVHKLCGSKNGKFKIKEWEVYRLNFPSKAKKTI